VVDKPSDISTSSNSEISSPNSQIPSICNIPGVNAGRLCQAFQQKNAESKSTVESKSESSSQEVKLRSLSKKGIFPLGISSFYLLLIFFRKKTKKKNPH
jgi:hypothetical protein